MDSLTKQRKAWRVLRVLTFTIFIHSIFVAQLVVAMEQQELVLREFAFVFYPHTILMYCLPPAFDPQGGRVDCLRLLGKILDAVPASLAYGFIVSYLSGLIINIVSSKTDGVQNEKTMVNNGEKAVTPKAPLFFARKNISRDVAVPAPFGPFHGRGCGGAVEERNGIDFGLASFVIVSNGLKHDSEGHVTILSV